MNPAAPPPRAPSGAHILTTTIAIPAESFTITAALPELLSQLNVEAVAAIPVRAYLDALRAPGFPLAVARLGKLRLVDRVAFVAWLRSQTGASSHGAPSPANDAAEDQGADAGQPGDGVLAEFGLERITPATGRKRASAGGRP